MSIHVQVSSSHPLSVGTEHCANSKAPFPNGIRNRRRTGRKKTPREHHLLHRRFMNLHVQEAFNSSRVSYPKAVSHTDGGRGHRINRLRRTSRTCLHIYKQAPRFCGALHNSMRIARRKERDSNPRSLAAQRFSRPPQSTTLPSFRTQKYNLFSTYPNRYPDGTAPFRSHTDGLSPHDAAPSAAQTGPRPTARQRPVSADGARRHSPSPNCRETKR